MITQLSHPLYLHKLSILRDEKTPCNQFRNLISELSLLLCMKATECLDITTTKPINSPVGNTILMSSMYWIKTQG
jgi:uracil phosphoribosyltransferase